MRVISLIFMFGFLIGCSSAQETQDVRIHTVYKSIEMMKQYDISNLISIVDTSYCYDVYGFEGFENIIKYVNQKIKFCSEPSKEKFKFQYNEGLKYTEIFVPFKCVENNNLINNHFDIVFRFFDYASKDKIGFINILKHSQLNKPEPTKPLPPN